jgi:hypothetical protein
MRKGEKARIGGDFGAWGATVRTDSGDSDGHADDPGETQREVTNAEVHGTAGTGSGRETRSATRHNRKRREGRAGHRHP